MKQLLKDKLIEIGYEQQFIEQRLQEWKHFNDSISEIEKKPNQEIQLYLFDKPTVEIPKSFLNVVEDFEDVFVLEGEINLQIQESQFFGAQVHFADYALDKKLCFISITKSREIQILKYSPNIDIMKLYCEKTYEDVFAKERESLLNDYLQALTSNQKLTYVKAKEVLYVLTSEYIIDKIIAENLNPRLKLYDEAEKFAENITNYEYQYINQTKNKVEILKRQITPKEIGCGVKLGNISNKPYLDLRDANQTAEFALNRPSYVWLSSNHNGKEELSIYTSNIIYSSKTYRKWLEEREDMKLIEKAEELTSYFSSQVGHIIARDVVLDVLKRLNRELIVLPTDFIMKYMDETSDQIVPISYHFTAITEPKDFESFLYVSLENYLNGMYRYRMVERLTDIHTIIGKKINYTDINGNSVQEQSLANFNMKANTAILKKESLITPNLLSVIEEKLLNFDSASNQKELEKKEQGIEYDRKFNLDILPVPRMDVVFYFPEIAEESKDTMSSSKEIVFYYQSGYEECQKGMTKVWISYVTHEGVEIKEKDEILAWIGENFTPDIPTKLTDKNGLMWEYMEIKKPIIQVKETEKNEVTLIYDKLERKVKIKFVDEEGKRIKEAQEEIYQVGEIIKYEQNLDYIDSEGKHWKAKTLNKVNQRVSEKEEENTISLIYEKQLTIVTITFQNEFGQKIMADKIEKVQVGSKYKLNQEKEVIDDNGQYWISIKRPEEFEIKEGENIKILFQCKPLMTKVIVQYIDAEGKDILPAVQEDVQVGSIFVPKIVRTLQGTEGKRWMVSPNQLNEFKIKRQEDENKILVKYDPVLVNVTIRFQDIEGKEIRRKEVILKQIGSEWTPTPDSMIKDEKGNEWQLIEKEYETIVVTENEKENVVTYCYHMAKGNVTISYLDLEGTILKPEEHFTKQVGSAFMPTPEPFMLDKENRKWKLNKVQPAMLKVKAMDNKVIVTYQQEKTKVTWKYVDTEGNELRSEEIHMVQIGEKYTPLVSDTTIQKEGQTWKLLKLEPFEIIVKENVEENIVTLIYIKVAK